MTDILGYTFFQNALLAVVIISVASAVVGTYIVTRRLVAISGSVTHACFGGLGLGYYLGISPILMAGVFAVASSAGVEWLSSRLRIRDDSAIGVIWSLGMAAGVLFVFLTPGYVPELNAFLFGNILNISFGDIWAFAIYTVVLIAFFACYYRTIVACAFDRNFAQVSGLPVRLINYTMTALVAICIVLTIRLVGIMLLMSMLTLPQMIAETRCHRYLPLMFASVAVSALSCIGGLLLCIYIDVPCSALIVILLCLELLVAQLWRAHPKIKDNTTS